MEVYKQYIYAASKVGFILYLFTVAGQQATSVLGTLTLRYWGEHNQELGNNSSMFKYLLVYGLFSLSSSILGGVSAIIMWVYCALRSARHLHDNVRNHNYYLFDGIQTYRHYLDARISYARSPELFRINSHRSVSCPNLFSLSIFNLVHRILNLFSRDTYVVDQVLPRVVQGLCRTLAVSLSIIIVIGSSFPPFLLTVLPLGWLYLKVMRFVDMLLKYKLLTSMNADITLPPHENWSGSMPSVVLLSLPGSRSR